MTQTVLAVLGLVICAALLLRMCLSLPHQRRVDAFARRCWLALRAFGLRIWYGLLQLRHGRTARKDAAQVAEETIRRARGDVAREGNVYKPKSFRGPRKPH